MIYVNLTRIGWAIYVRSGWMSRDAWDEGVMYQPFVKFLLRRFLNRGVRHFIPVIAGRIG